MRCPGCGRDGIEGGRFCEHCGHSLSPTGVYPTLPPAESVRPVDKRFLMMVLMFVAVTMIGTVILSPLILTSESEETAIVVGPHSYYAVRLEVYGIGVIEYTQSQISGPDVYLLELTQGNFERFEAGEEFDYKGYGALGVGGEGFSSEMGPMWVRYLVFVNDNSIPATVDFGYRATAFASLLIAGPLAAASLLILLCAVIVTRGRPRAV